MWAIVHVDRLSWTFSAGHKVRQVDNDVMSTVRKLEDHAIAIAGSVVLGVVHQMVG